MAFTLADGIGYVEAAIERGLPVDSFAPRLSFFFNAHIDFFEEIAKYRAARRIWARVMRERFGAKNPRSWLLRFHTQTAGCSLTAQQPYNNVVRTAFEALAAVLREVLFSILSRSLNAPSPKTYFPLISNHNLKTGLIFRLLLEVDNSLIQPLAELGLLNF